MRCHTGLAPGLLVSPARCCAAGLGCLNQRGESVRPGRMGLWGQYCAHEPVQSRNIGDDLEGVLPNEGRGAQWRCGLVFSATKAPQLHQALQWALSPVAKAVAVRRTGSAARISNGLCRGKEDEKVSQWRWDRSGAGKALCFWVCAIECLQAVLAVVIGGQRCSYPSLYACPHLVPRHKPLSRRPRWRLRWPRGQQR